VIGDSATLEADPGIKSFIDYCHEKAAVIKVDQIL
jgi:hypothetical protein